MSNKDKPTPISRETFLNNLKEPYQIPEQDYQPYDNRISDPTASNFGLPDFIRGNEISMSGDTHNTISISLEDLDNAILFYIRENIKPTVEINGLKQSIPVIYGSPERWKSMQKDGFYRDKNGKAMLPIIALKRESFEKDRRLGNKLDGNKAQNIQYIKQGFSKRNSYDNFAVLTNQKPSEEYQVSIIPDYILLKYTLVIFTDYMEHMNSILESIEFASDSYWGDPQSFQFRSSITQYPTPTQVDNGNDRGIKSELTLDVNGYIIPKSVNVSKAAPSPKSFNTTKTIFKEFSETNQSVTRNIPVGSKRINIHNPSNNQRIDYYGIFNGTFIGDGSQLTNLPIPSGSNINTGSLVTTSSFNNFTSSYNTGSFTGSFIGDGSQLTNIPTLSGSIDTGSLVTTSSFNNFTSSYNTGSFTGSFTGDGSQLTNISVNIPTASYIQGGIITTSSQFIAGDKTFKGSSSVNGSVLTLLNSSGSSLLEIGNDKVLRVTDGFIFNLMRTTSLVADSPRFKFSGPNIISQEIYAEQGSIYFTKGLVVGTTFQISNSYLNFGNQRGSAVVPLITALNGAKCGLYFTGGSGLAGVAISTNNLERLRVETTGELLLGTSIVDNSAKLNVSSTTQGSLPNPRMTRDQRLSIPSPAIGLEVYQTDGISGSYIYNGSVWRRILIKSSTQTRDYTWYAYGNGYNDGSIIGFRTSMAGRGSNKNFSNNNTSLYTRTNFFGRGTTTTAGDYAAFNANDDSYRFIHGYTDWYFNGVYTDSSNTVVTDKNIFWGVCGNYQNTNVTPSTLSYDQIALVKDNTDTNFNILFGKVGSPPTKIDLGVDFPANTSKIDVYSLEIQYSVLNNEAYITVERKNTGHIFNYTISSSNLPDIGNFLYCGINKMTNGTSNVQTSFGVNKIILSNTSEV